MMVWVSVRGSQLWYGENKLGLQSVVHVFDFEDQVNITENGLSNNCLYVCRCLTPTIGRDIADAVDNPHELLPSNTDGDTPASEH